MNTNNIITVEKLDKSVKHVTERTPVKYQEANNVDILEYELDNWLTPRRSSAQSTRSGISSSSSSRRSSALSAAAEMMINNNSANSLKEIEYAKSK